MFPLAALQLGLIIAIGLTCVALWNYIFAQVSSRQEIVSYEPRRCVPWSGSDVGLAAVAWLAMQILCTLPFALETTDSATTAETQTVDAVDEEPEEMTAVEKHPFGLMVAVSVGNAVAVSLACLWLRRRGADRRDLGFTSPGLGRDLQLGVGGFAAASIPVFIIQLVLVQFIPAKHAVSDIFEAQPGLATLLATAFSAVVMAPLAEEFFFRVVLQGWLEAVYAERAYARLAPAANAADIRSEITSPAADGFLATVATVATSSVGSVPVAPMATTISLRDDPQVAPTLAESSPAFRSFWPVILSSLVFALVHLGNGPSPVPLFFFALVLGYLYRQTHRIWPSIIAHASLNALSTLMLAAGAS